LVASAASAENVHFVILVLDIRWRMLDPGNRRAGRVRQILASSAVVFGQIATDTAPGDRFVIDDEDSRLHANSAVEW